jgi:hypothetical protein
LFSKDRAYRSEAPFRSSTLGLSKLARGKHKLIL